jgi:hypothetical protein
VRADAIGSFSHLQKLTRNAERFLPPLLFSLVHPPILLCGFVVMFLFATISFVAIQPREPDDQT